MEYKNMKNQEDQDDYDNNESPINGTVVIWGIASVAVAIFMITFNDSGMVLRAGFMAKFFAFVVGSILGFIGAMIGDAICRFARPDAVFTQGFSGLVFAKLFWILGPQLIGLVVGTLLGISLVLG